MEVYATTAEEPPEDQPRYALRRSIEQIKAEVGIDRYLTDQGMQLKSFGKELRTRCILHGGDNNQAFSVNTEKGLWHCFRCNEGGDVISLCQKVEGGEPWEALMTLSQRYSVELPRRPDRWHHWQDEKSHRRKLVRDALTASYQRRYFRVFGTYLEDIGDEEERRDEAEQFWKDLRSVAQIAAENRMQR